jgi:DNA-binding MarR family transcriptional regulator
MLLRRPIVRRTASTRRLFTYCAACGARTRRADSPRPDSRPFRSLCTLTLSALADAEQVRAPTITRVVAALEGAGLVTREPDPSDGRAALVRATPAGERLLGEARARRLRALSSEMEDLPPEDLATLTRAADILERLVRIPEHR